VHSLHGEGTWMHMGRWSIEPADNHQKYGMIISPWFPTSHKRSNVLILWISAARVVHRSIISLHRYQASSAAEELGRNEKSGENVQPISMLFQSN